MLNGLDSEKIPFGSPNKRGISLTDTVMKLGWRILARYWEFSNRYGEILVGEHGSNGETGTIQVIHRGHLNAAGGYAESRILDST